MKLQPHLVKVREETPGRQGSRISRVLTNTATTSIEALWFCIRDGGGT
jgi:hypothetical protein